MAGRITSTLKETARERRARLAKLDRRLDALVFVAAILSIPPAAQAGDLTGAILVVDIIAWLIFVLEAVVKISAHGRDEYLADRWNWVDIGIIVLSAPYHLATGIPIVTRLSSLARLARLVRIALVMTKVLRQGRSIMSRRNVPTAAALVVLATVGMAGFVFVMESGAGNPAFGSFGDSLWWSIVTLTTVGYGDISPLTTAGRIGAVVLMMVGVAFLGTLAATLASFFIADDEAESDERTEEDLEALKREITALRTSVDAIARKLDANGPDRPAGPGT